MLRTLLLPLVTLTLAAQTPAPKPVKKPAAKPAATAAPKDKILARINGKPVTESEFMLFLDMAYSAEQRMQIGMAEGALAQVQEQYLRTRLLEAKARKDGLDKGAYFAKKRALVEMDILVRALFERDGAKLQEKSKVSEADVKAFYEKHPDKFKTAETFTARHILIGSKESPAPDAAELKEEDVKAKVTKVQEALKGGKPFEEAAKEFSDDPGSKEKGGLYENITFGAFVPEFEAAVRAQKPGVVGEPVKTPYGYHLIIVDKITPSELMTFEASKEKAEQLATQERQEQVMQDFVAAIKKEIPYVETAPVKKAADNAAATPGSN